MVSGSLQKMGGSLIHAHLLTACDMGFTHQDTKRHKTFSNGRPDTKLNFVDFMQVLVVTILVSGYVL